MKTKEKTLVGIICVVIVFCMISTTSFAWTPITSNGYKLIGGVCNREFNIIGQSVTYNGKTVEYASSIRTAVSNWNSAVNWSYTNPVDVQFAETTSSTGSEMIIKVQDISFSGYIGYTLYHDTNGNYLNSYGSLPTNNYAYCDVLLNVVSLHDKDTVVKTNVCAHEMGHVLGLDHSLEDTSLMVSNIYEKSIAVPSIGLRKPTGDDITGVQAVNK